jgi:hypothetical protein
MTLLKTIHFVGCIIFLSAPLSCPLHAEPTCRSDFLLVQLTTCAAREHGPIFNEFRSPKCKVESYKSCSEKRRVYSDSYYFDAGRHDCKLGGEAWLKDPTQRALAVASATQNYFEKYVEPDDDAWDRVLADIEKTRRPVGWRFV